MIIRKKQLPGSLVKDWLNKEKIVRGPEIDYMEYATDGAAQAAYVSSAASDLQVYSESSIVTQGTYSLKGIADQTDSLGDSITRTLGSTIDLTGVDTLKYDIRSSRTGSNLRLQLLNTPDTYTKLLLHMDGANDGTTFTDETGKTVTRVNAVTKTATKKFGTASCYCDGVGDYLTLADSADWALGSTWTVDFWIYSNATGSQGYFGQTVNANSGWGFRSNGTGTKLYLEVDYTGWYVGWNNFIQTAGWHHVAIVCNNNVLKAYYDGSEQTSTSSVGSVADIGDYAAVFMVGGSFVASVGTFTASAYIDEFKVSKGVARWTSNFTPPTIQHDTIETTPNITVADVWGGVEADITSISDAEKGQIKYIKVYVDNANADNTFYIDNFYGEYNE